MIRCTCSMLVVAQLTFGACSASAYEVETHAPISEIAGVKSQVEDILKNHIGLNGGLSTVAERLRLISWLGAGAKREDNLLRLLNHFHNPLAGWSQAGLLGSVGQSSVLWGQNLSQGVPGWSWTDVRQR